MHLERSWSCAASPSHTMGLGEVRRQTTMMNDEDNLSPDARVDGYDIAGKHIDVLGKNNDLHTDDRLIQVIISGASLS